jgi:hypothetical protein
MKHEDKECPNCLVCSCENDFLAETEGDWWKLKAQLETSHLARTALNGAWQNHSTATIHARKIIVENSDTRRGVKR